MSDEEKAKMKRRLDIQKISLESDLKKVQRKQLDLSDDLSRFNKERSRVDVYIKENKIESKKLTEKEDYINDEIKRLKKKLIEIV